MRFLSLNLGSVYTNVREVRTITAGELRRRMDELGIGDDEPVIVTHLVPNPSTRPGDLVYVEVHRGLPCPEAVCRGEVRRLGGGGE